MSRKKHRSRDYYDNSCQGGNNDVETIYRPTKNVQNIQTNRRTKRVVHPTHIQNINKDIVRVENYYPVSESNVNKTVVEEYDCGSDINSPNCRRVSPSSNNDGGSNCGCH